MIRYIGQRFCQLDYRLPSSSIVGLWLHKQFVEGVTVVFLFQSLEISDDNL